VKVRPLLLSSFWHEQCAPQFSHTAVFAVQCFIVVKDTCQPPTLAELQKFAAQSLAPYKVRPKEFCITREINV
jgi:hypothetical protein